MFHFFEEVNFFEETFKSGKYQLLEIGRSSYINILIKSQKGLELVSSLHHWTKNMLEMFVIQHTSIWPNLIFMVLRIQKK